MIHLGTSFLVDLLREVRRGRGALTEITDKVPKTGAREED